ncbi:GWxTD domain-containing protein [Acidobacteriota bacterium]
MRKWVYAIAFLFFLGLIIPCQAVAENDKDRYEKWVDNEALLLLSQEEMKEFKSLKTDEERDKFIELFWAKRDPSPGTEENEFKVEWYERLKYVEENFKSGLKKGIKSDMGRVYMYFGPPSRTRGGAGGTKAESTGGSQIEAPPQAWIYQAMPDLGLNQPFSVIFRQYQYGYDLDQLTPQTILRAMEIFPKVVQFNPDLKELPKFRFRLDANSFEGKLISEFKVSGEGIEQIPFQWAPHFSQAANESTYIYLTVLIDTKTTGLKKDEELTFFGTVDGSGGKSEEFLKTIKPEKTKSDNIVVGFGFPATSDNYTLYLGLRNEKKDKYSLLKAPLEVPEYWNAELAISSVILSPKVDKVEKKEEETEGYNPYVFGQLEATPRLGSVFKSSENMSIIFQVYNAKVVEDEASLQLEYFIEAPEGTYRLKAQEFKKKVETGKTITGGTEIPLSPLKPGDYRFKIKVIDRNAVKIIEKEVPFTVK